MTLHELNTGFHAAASWLHDWQELAGAVIGAGMGVVGAMIVAINSTRSERRAACRALITDALLIKRMVIRVKSAPRTEGLTPAGWLIKQVKRYRFELSPLFENQMLKIAGVDPRSFGCLKAVSTIHGQIDSLLDEMEVTYHKSPIGTRDANEQIKLMTNRLDALDNMAKCADYLLTPECESGMSRLRIRLRRKISPTAEEAQAQKLLAGLAASGDIAKEDKA